MRRRCDHDIVLQILAYHSIKPRTLTEAFRRLGLKYPDLKKHIEKMLILGWLIPASSNTLQTTELGDLILEVYRLHNTTIKELQEKYNKAGATPYAFIKLEQQRKHSATVTPTLHPTGA